MESKRLLIAALLSVLVLVVWQAIFAPEPPPPGIGDEGREMAERIDPSRAEDAPRSEPGMGERPAGTAPPADGLADSLESSAEAAAAEPVREPVGATGEERVRIDTELYAAELTNRGAQLLSFRLKRHPGAQTEIVDLVRDRSEGPYPFALAGPGLEGLNEALFAVERGRGDSGEPAVAFRYRGPAGEAVKRFTFGPRGILEVEMEVPGRNDWGFLIGPGLRNPSAKELDNRFARRTAVYLAGDELEEVDPQKATTATVIPGLGLRWAGLQDIYFLAAVVPGDPLAQVVFEPTLMDASGDGAPRFVPFPATGELSEAEEELVRELRMVVLPGGERFAGHAFLGAKRYDALTDLPYSLERSIELGFFAFLARPLLWGLNWIHDNLVSNYGWAIILMTLLIRILLFPLNHKSIVSMQKMQDLNPKMQAIRQKFRPRLKDKQGRANPEAQRKMNEEIMALYKKEGVNPAGGCLPMLLQIPVLFAFYRLLSAAIELRYAPWMLWIQDLSAPDPYYVLPIVMGATQFLQQKMTPSSADPMQRRIFMLMPVFFTVLFLGFPSGLVLYWLTNNVLGIAQQAIYKRRREQAAAA